MRVAVIGVGDVGRWHAVGVQVEPAAELVAVCDADPRVRERAAGRFGVAAFPDVAAVFSGAEFDVVCLCLPNHLHLPAGRELLRAGKHLLLEKPMANTIAECDELLAVAGEAGATLRVSPKLLCVPAVRRARELLDSGRYGSPVVFRQRFGWNTPLGGWRDDAAATGPGILGDAGAHAFYLGRFFCGEIVGAGAILDAPREVGDYLALVVLEFASGARGVVEMNLGGPRGMMDDATEAITDAATLRLGGVEARSSGYRSDLPPRGVPGWRLVRPGGSCDVVAGNGGGERGGVRERPRRR